MLKKNLKTSILIVSCFIASVGFGQTQDLDKEDLDIIELELDKSVAKKEVHSPVVQEVKVESKPKDNTIKDFNELGTLAPFSEISIIQKKYMPKTGRFQFFSGATTVTNDPFFNTFGLSLKGSYFFSENLGIEGNFSALSTIEAQSTNELKNNNNVKAESLAYPKSFYGISLNYSPIYGKITWFNERILPFDLYFSAGYGMTEVSSGESAGTIHLGTGQIFALTKSTAFRWDFSWNIFNSTVQNDTSATSSSFNNLFLTVGMSWFFPEAKYR